MSLRTAKVISLLVTVIGAGAMLQGASFSWLGNQQGYEPEQPIAFSHRVHAGDNQISCLYCHSAAEKSKIAGIPAASTCMNCHSQIRKDSPEIQKITSAIANNKPIEWMRVHRVPDHVSFDHSRHVSVGIKCQQCHGPVETMDRVSQFETLSMGMCVNCHRTHREVSLDESGKPIISREATPKRLMASTDCSVCHH
ncbi:MAG TPA: cytochrome c3 family protein [Blastocatellia bacterium]|nr:cytochrome c3 family protein [Blastocatellia bacterium]